MSTSAEAKKPASYYDLLKLEPFESDIGLVRKHFHKIVEQVRAKIAAEPASPRWPAMLNEMTSAMLVLSDARRKSDYDASIGGKQGRDVRLVDIEKLVQARKVLEPAALEKAQKFADTVNLELHEAIINQKLAPPDVVMPLYAESLGLPFVELSDLTFDESLIAVVPAVLARQNSLTPVLIDDGQVVVASPKPLKPEIDEQLRLRFSKQIRQVICTKAAIDEAIGKYYSREAAVAQMSTVPQAPTSSASGSSSGSAPMSRLNKAELKKKKLKIGGIAGMMTFVAGVLLSTVMGWTAGSTFPLMVYLACGAVAAVSFSVAYLVVSE